MKIFKMMGIASLLACLALGVFVFARHDASPRVLVIGLDGADFNRMDPLIQRGELPNIQQLIDNGVRAPLKSLIPAISPAAWVAFTSGKNPGKSGVLHFLHRHPENPYRIYDIDADQCAVKRTWEILGDRGKHVIVQGVPITYPPRQVNGIMISGWLSPRNSIYTHPPDLTQSLKAKGYVTFVEQVKVWGPSTPPDQYQTTIDTHWAIDQIRRDTALEVMTGNPWDFSMVVFENIDHVQHVIHSDMKPVEEYYRRMDSVVGDLVKAAGPDSIVMIGSDHGFGRIQHHFNLRNWLESNNLLKYQTVSNITFTGTIDSGRPLMDCRPFEFEPNEDRLESGKHTVQFDCRASYGEDGIDFNVEPGTELGFDLKALLPGEDISIPVRVGLAGSVIPNPFRVVSLSPEQIRMAQARLHPYYGKETDETLEVDLGTVQADSDGLNLLIHSSGTRLGVLDYLKITASDGREYFIESEDEVIFRDVDYSNVPEADGKWWRQPWERFRGGSAWVAHPSESVPPIRIKYRVSPGEYRLFLGTFTGTPQGKSTSLIIEEVPGNDPAGSPGSNADSFIGRPLFVPGVDSGYFLWVDESGWHLRWSGAGKEITKTIDWSKTYAWDPFWSVCPFGCIYFNVKDREPNGTIDPADYQKARDGLADMLKNYVDPKTGIKVVINTFNREDLYTGPFTSEMPDLLFEVDPDYCIYHRCTGSHHKRDGVFILSGPGIKKGFRTDASILDVTPTILYAMNLPVADAMDGQVVLEAFDPEFVAAHPVQRISSYEDGAKTTRATPKSQEISKEIEDRLKSLGYIGE